MELTLRGGAELTMSPRVNSDIMFFVGLEDTHLISTCCTEVSPIPLCFDPLFLSGIWAHGHTVRETERGMQCNK